MNSSQERPTIVSCGHWGHIRFARARHRDYPEARGEGKSVAEAVAQLRNQLARALDCARDPSARESIRRALEEVGQIGR